MSTIEKKKGLISLFVHYFVHRGRNSRFRHKDHRVSSVFFLQRKTFENKKVKGETQDEKRVKNKKKHAHKTKGVQIDLNI